MASTSLCCVFYVLTLSCCGLVGPANPAAALLPAADTGDEPASHLLHHDLHYESRRSRKALLDTEDLPRTEEDELNGYTMEEDEEDDEFTSRGGQRGRHGGQPPPRSPNSPILRTTKNGTKKLPQALIIGVKKGGTRALLEFLRIHPDIRAPGPEPHFFDRHYHRGLEWYRNQMPLTIEGQITMEKTPSYFVTKGVPGRIYNMSKDMKLIVVVRDPVTRAISDYTQAASKRAELKPFPEMAFLDNVTGLVDTSWGAIRIGVYAKHLERWLKYFPLAQMHFVNGEKLISDPAGEVAKVQDFLGLKRVITDKHFYFNSTKGFPCLKKPEGSGNPHCLGKTKGRTHPEVDRKVIKRLREFFRPFNAKFYQMTNQDFGWP